MCCRHTGDTRPNAKTFGDIQAKREGDRLEISTTAGAKSVWIELAPGRLMRESELERQTLPEGWND